MSWLLVVLVLGACGPAMTPHPSDATAPDASDFIAFTTCDPAWGLASTVTCQTPCVDQSNLGEDVACAATSPLNGATIMCDPTLQITIPGHHGCCVYDQALDPNRVHFAECR